MHSKTTKKNTIRLLVAWYVLLAGGYITLLVEGRVPIGYFFVAVIVSLYAFYQVTAFFLGWVMVGGFGREIKPDPENRIERIFYFFSYFSGLLFLSGLMVFIYMGNEFPFYIR